MRSTGLRWALDQLGIDVMFDLSYIIRLFDERYFYDKYEDISLYTCLFNFGLELNKSKHQIYDISNGIPRVSCY